MLTRALEFVVLFIAVPLAVFAYFEYISVFAVYGLIFLISLFLLHKTPDFNWRELVDIHTLKRQGIVLAVSFVTTALVVGGLAWHFLPERFLSTWEGRESLLLRILLFYPFLSALPQEVMYRVLFFKRYRQLFYNTNAAILANASCFSLLHIFYQNWFAVGLTFVGGIVFAWAYVHRNSFTLAWVMHSLGGQLIFISGLGIYFYHGAI